MALGPIPISDRQGDLAERQRAYDADVADMKAHPGSWALNNTPSGPPTLLEQAIKTVKAELKVDVEKIQAEIKPTLGQVIQKLIDADDEDTLTAEGIPTVDALTRLLGRPVTAAERDAALEE